MAFAEPLVGATVPPIRTKPRNPRVAFIDATTEYVVVAKSWLLKRSTWETYGTFVREWRRRPVVAPCSAYKTPPEPPR
jgi:hypothetical protein